MDNISKAYIEMRLLSEMTVRTDSKGSLLTDDDVKDIKEHKHFLNFVHVGGYEIGSIGNDVKMKYVTFKGEEPIHTAELATNRNGSRIVPFPHDYHEMVYQHPEHRGISRLVMHHHVDTSGRALVAGPYQSSRGNRMWHKFTNESLDRGHHVYLWDGANLHKTDKNNLKSHLNAYYGDGKCFQTMVVSKDPINT